MEVGDFMKKILKLLGISIIIILFVFYIYTQIDVYDPSPMNYLEIEQIQGDNLYWPAKGIDQNIEIIMYPGGKVEYESYAVLANAIAEKGFGVTIVKMPLNLAVFGYNKANEIIDQDPDKKYVMMGHSLGGSMAAKFAYDHPALIEGLIFLASYPAKSNDFSQSSLDVLSIYASNDAFATKEKIEASKVLLPSDAVFYEIQGGNHSQFGSYGFQKGDGVAEISSGEQLMIVVDRITQFLMK